ncbi:uncharacterized protein JN550_001382 [Neoarthrinium moseri]|uniref:uncharacterized protein n=1 Tax=Neoarthrinium moseri TaxID=1658444 RepID=UPI001FDE7DDE|nr:uncharacterized protein JN550_001382 [Neoarthrinium moseri]KAI1877310.1 hypothetical protein JN550_001382 [Neoarthrinium moseri]
MWVAEIQAPGCTLFRATEILRRAELWINRAGFVANYAMLALATPLVGTYGTVSIYVLFSFASIFGVMAVTMILYLRWHVSVIMKGQRSRSLDYEQCNSDQGVSLDEINVTTGLIDTLPTAVATPEDSDHESIISRRPIASRGELPISFSFNESKLSTDGADKPALYTTGSTIGMSVLKSQDEMRLETPISEIGHRTTGAVPHAVKARNLLVTPAWWDGDIMEEKGPHLAPDVSPGGVSAKKRYVEPRYPLRSHASLDAPRNNNGFGTIDDDFAPKKGREET